MQNYFGDHVFVVDILHTVCLQCLIGREVNALKSHSCAGKAHSSHSVQRNYSIREIDAINDEGNICSSPQLNVV